MRIHCGVSAACQPASRERAILMSTDTIQFSQIVKQLPKVLAKVPNMLKAARYLNPLNTKVSLGKVIEDAAAKHPHNAAIIYQDVELTYQQFNAHANKVAHYLIGQGIKKGDVIGLFMENRPEFLICAVGIAKVGAVAALINTSQTGRVLSHSLNLVQPKMAIVGEELTAPFDEIRADLKIPADQVYFVADRNILTDFGTAPTNYKNLAEVLSSQPSGNPPTTAQVEKDDELFYIYTSGTTGMPKASITNHLRWLAAMSGFGCIISGMKPTDRFYLTLPLYHATGLLVCWGAIVSGPAAVVIGRRFSATRFWDDVHKYRCTGFGYVGELCRYLLNQPARANDHDNQIRMMIGNGLRPAIWKQFKERFAVGNIYEFYASSEGNVAFLNIFNMDNTMGFGGGNVAVVQYDKEAEQPIRDSNGFMIKAQPGEAGLLMGKITKATPFVGYTQKEKTEAALLRDVFKKGDVYFNTGDLVRNIGCKHYQFVDRTGDTFRWKSQNVSTTEVENIFILNPQIAEAMVYGVQVAGADGRAGMASITPSVNLSDLDLKGLFEYLSKELPAFAVPVFLRIKENMETTGTFKYKKSDAKTEGFDPNIISDPLFLVLPGTREYVALTKEIFAEIQADKHRF